MYLPQFSTLGGPCSLPISYKGQGCMQFQESMVYLRVCPDAEISNILIVSSDDTVVATYLWPASDCATVLHLGFIS